MMNGSHQQTGPSGGKFMARQKREGEKTPVTRGKLGYIRTFMPHIRKLAFMPRTIP